MRRNARTGRRDGAEPTRAEAYCNIGVVFKMTNRVDDAVRAFEQCLRLSPEFALGRKNLSLVLTDQGTEKKKSLRGGGDARACADVRLDQRGGVL